jgi:hypothetical protein
MEQHHPAVAVVRDERGCPIAKGGVARPFPWRVHDMLDAAQKEGLGHIVSWQSHGRAFTVHKPKDFVEQIMPRYVCTGRLYFIGNSCAKH